MGGGIFKEKWFHLMDDDPEEMLCTFITCDTAESSKDYADKTVFSFWGLYKVEDYSVKTETLALHSIDGVELLVEPKDLESEFKSFYADCMRYKYQPRIAVIEKKSTGVTLYSVLSGMRGIEIRGIDRTKASGSKTDRYLEMQHVVASGLISFPAFKRHSQVYIKHLSKITANDTHRYDDICDTLYDAVKIALLDKTLYNNSPENEARDKITSELSSHYNAITAAHRSLL
jgi:predicted phage terminase large subunit-like protein